MNTELLLRLNALEIAVNALLLQAGLNEQVREALQKLREEVEQVHGAPLDPKLLGRLLQP